MEEKNQIPDGMEVPVGSDPNMVTDGFISSEENTTPRKRTGKTFTKAIIFAVVGIAVVAGAVWGLKYFSDKQDNCEKNPDKTQCTEAAKDSDSSGQADKKTEAKITDAEGKETVLAPGDFSATFDGKQASYSGANVIDGVEVVIDGGDFISATDNQNVFLVVNGGKLTLKNATVTKTGSEDFQGRGDNYSFYGLNSAIVVVGENSSINLENVVISTTVSGSNAVVATQNGKVTIANSKIGTTKDNSRGLHATYGGVITAESTEISTLGGSCATLATDRGAGTVTATGMTLSTAGSGSPLIYSTGDITLKSSTGTATGAQIAVVEGKNSIVVENSQLSANGYGNREGKDNAAVMIYQSMSGDASVGTGNFTATDSSLTVLSDSKDYDEIPFFFITNTEAKINLKNVTASFHEEMPFISAKGTSEWGRSGSNGGKVTYSGTDVRSSSTIVEVDNISSVSGL